MKVRNLVVVLAIVAAFSAALFFQQDDPAPTITSSPPLIDKPVTQSSTEKIPKVSMDGIDWDSMTSRMLSGEFTVEEEQAFNELHVLPLNWINQIDCSEDSQCLYTMKYPPHPYASIDKEELFELGYADPLAALFLGMRYGEDWTEKNISLSLMNEEDFKTAYEERISLYLRAAALSGMTGPLMRLVGTGREGHSPMGVPEPVIKIAILRIAEKLGDPRADWKAELAKDIVSLQVIDVAEFDEHIEDWYQNYMNMMAHVQQDVTGSGQIMEFAHWESDK